MGLRSNHSPCRLRRLRFGFLFALGLTLAACESQDEGAGFRDPANGAYTGLPDLPGTLRLTDGRWEGEPVVPGGASRPSVSMVPGFRATGDLGPDGSSDTVVLLAANHGGSGEFLYAVLLEKADDFWVQADLLPLGDRVQLRGGRIDRGALFLHLVEAGPRDAACCPGDVVTRGWRPDADGTLLAFDTGIPRTRLSWATLDGSAWVLHSWSVVEETASEPSLTLVAGSGTASGASGCNRFSLAVEDGASPGEVSFGPAAGTRKACPSSLMDIEKRYLRRLAQVKKLAFVAGRLALSYQDSEGWDRMLFDPVAIREPPAN